MPERTFLAATLFAAFLAAACGRPAVDGTYCQDWAEMEPAALAALADMPELSRLDAEAREEALAIARAKMGERMGESDFRLVLEPGGEFRVTSRRGDAAAVTAHGKWDLEGERLTLTTTHENGAPNFVPDVRFATLSEDSIRMRPDASFPFDLVLTRR